MIDASGLYAVPGFIDIHTHGASLFDLTQGLYDPQTRTFEDSDEAYATGIDRTMQAMAAEGTTRVLLATVASPTTSSATPYVAGRYIRSEANGRRGALLDGVLLEGTFIRYPEFAVPQNPEYFLSPKRGRLRAPERRGSGNIAYVNVVPEYGEAARPLMEHLTRHRVLIGAGHTDASAEQYAEAVRWGLKVAIHFTNGPTGSTFKPFGGGGVLQAVLGFARFTPRSSPTDTTSTPPTFSTSCGERASIASSPSPIPCSLPAWTPSRSSSLPASKDGAARMDDISRWPASDAMLFGSVLCMRVAFANFLSWLTKPMRGIWKDVHDPLDLDEAILAASHFCSVNPARAMEIFDPPTRSSDRTSACAPAVSRSASVPTFALIRVEGEPGEYAMSGSGTPLSADA